MAEGSWIGVDMDAGRGALSHHASALARVALENVERPYPNLPAHVMRCAGDLATPRSLHPAFYGSYDWHSAVHMHWLLARLLNLFPGIVEKTRIAETFNRHFTPANIEAEARYFLEPAHRSFERTYGWAWLLKLQAELLLAGRLVQPGWSRTVQPLADTIVARYLDFLPKAPFPIRAGTHGNSAFGLLFALEYAKLASHRQLEELVVSKALQWFRADRQYPAAYEPGGEDFLSGGLMEAALMRQVLERGRFSKWWDAFRPKQDELRT